jgi:hypothetical protein
MGTREKNVVRLCTVFVYIITLILRTDPTSFACLLPDNKTTLRKDRVIANSDGAFIIKTNRKSGGPGRLIWDKQKTAIAFEVFRFESIPD